ncbi:hypothetical protein Leryth_003185 [Lithospermum erythrorhizon]|nr:hypothetical protein Leryth_003185 [Lithospermum erythrorhizon]
MMVMRVLGLWLLLMICVLIGNGGAQKDPFLINCGTNSTVSVNGRKWIGDTTSGNNVSLSSPGVEAITSEFSGDSAYANLYKTARIFSDSLNYSFSGAQGNQILRLYFYPFPFENYNANDSYVSISANGFQLVSKFNVPGEILQKNAEGNPGVTSLVKEYFFANDTNNLVLQFVPEKDSFGFVNAIEVIPVEDTLFVDSARKVSSNGANTSLQLGHRGIETMYRLNIGGSFIDRNGDSGFGRQWDSDSNYMITTVGSQVTNKSNISYASPSDASPAPISLYETARSSSMSDLQVMEKRINMSWKFPVDPGFDYLVRLHFCELEVNKPSQRIFKIYINNKTAAGNFDIFTRAGGKNKAYHEDYLDATSSDISSLWVQLGPDTVTSAEVSDALLNGLEVFKLSQSGNLAYAERYGDLGGKKSSRSVMLWVGIGGGIACIIGLAALVMLIVWFCKKKKIAQKDDKKNSAGLRPLFFNGNIVTSTTNAKGSSGYQNLNGLLGSIISGRHFTLTEIKAATHNFDESLVIGVGGFGKVFKGIIDDGILAAIKRANPQSHQGLKEFETEIEMLSKLRHKHLVSLIGFCHEQNEMILVYEYMANGTLRSQLFGSDLPPLSWKQRLEICIGSARGLHYLHTGSERGIIHRDVKTTNILLDECFVAKMADFGLSKTGPSLEHTHVSTAVKGSFGYLDPEYFRRQQLTEKSDVYSFGVVLFEVVCARAVINPTLPREQINLAEWAMQWQLNKSLETIIDPQLKGKYSPESLLKFGEIAEKCLAEEGKSRPTMGEVLWHLEYVLQLQEAWLQTIDGENSSRSLLPNSIHEREPVEEEEKEKEEGQETSNSGGETRLNAKSEGNGVSTADIVYQADHVVVGLGEFSQLNLQGR